MADSNAGAAANAAQGELVITRVFNAPRELVWKAWTEPERLARWWGPAGFAVSVVAFDLRPGGVFLYGMRTPDGEAMWGKFVYREVAAPERLVFVTSFADEAGNTIRAPFSADWALEVLSTLTLAEYEGRTTLTMHGVPINATDAERQTFAAFEDSMQEGWKSTLDQLADYLANA